MWRSFAIAFLSFPFTGLAFVIGWAAADLRTGLLAGAAVFTLFFTAAVVNLFFVKSYSYLDAALPAVFAALWSLALAPFSLGLSVFSAPAFIGAGLLLGGCLVIAKRYATGWRWLLLPAAVALLLCSAGLLRAEFFADEGTRWAALGAAMLMGGFGICTVLLGLPAVLRVLFLPKETALALTRVLGNVVLGGAALIGLSIYSAAVLLDSWPAQSADARSNILIAAAIMLAGITVRGALEFGRARRKYGLGEAGLDRDEIVCSPGEEIRLRLNTEKQAASVEAGLLFYGENDDEPRARYEAAVGPAEAGPKGWSYRITVRFPEGMPLPAEDGWCLSVKATGKNGGVYHDSLNVEPRGGRSEA
jgi:hypothetical protein